MNKSPSICFLICTEPGLLEKKSLLLATSIRTFGGMLSKVPIYSFQPRLGPKLSPKVRGQFEKLEVSHQVIHLNKDFPSYDFANKIFVASYAEKSLNTDYLVFIDSDQVVFDAPVDLILPASFDVGVRPVSTKNIGTDGRNDANLAYWKKLYKILGVQKQSYIMPSFHTAWTQSGRS